MECFFFALLLTWFWMDYWGVATPFHPNSSASPYNLYIHNAAIFGSTVYLVIAIFISCFERAYREGLQKSGRRFVLIVSVVPIFFFTVGFVFVEPVPRFFRQHVGLDAYLIPREFTLVQKIPSGPKSAVRIDYCPTDMTGLYESRERGCRHQAAFLSQVSIADGSDFSYFYKHQKELVLKEGIVSFASNTILMESDDDTFKHVIQLTEKSREHVLVLNARHELVMFAICFPSVKRCKIRQKTPIAVISFEVNPKTNINPHAWRAHGDAIATIVSQWRENER